MIDIGFLGGHLTTTQHVSQSAGTNQGGVTGCNRRDVVTLSKYSPLIRDIVKDDVRKGNHVVPLPYRAFYMHLHSGSYIKNQYLVQELDHCRPAGYNTVTVSGSYVTPPLLPPNVSRNSGWGNYFAVRNAYGVEALAVSQMLQDAKEMHIHLGMALTEAVKSVTFIHQVATTVAHSLRYAIMGKFSKAFKLLANYTAGRPPKKYSKKYGINSGHYGYADKQYLSRFHTRRERDLARKWLAWNYAVLPLYYDSIGAAEAVAEFGSRPIVFTAVGKATRKGERITNPTPFLRQRVSETVRCYISSTFWVMDTGIAGASQFGFSPSDIPSILWNLVPGSFIFDWLLDIGQWLEDMSATAGLQFQYGSHTLSTKWQFSSVVSKNTVEGGQRIIESAASQGTGFVMDRKRLFTVPIPIPIVKNPFSLSHLATIASILTGVKPSSLSQR